MYVYILQCNDSTYYTGVTNDIERRLAEHSSGVNKTCYTYKRRPVKLVFFESYSDAVIAIEYEKKIKRWSRRKKEALIKGEYESLPKLSKKHFKS